MNQVAMYLGYVFAGLVCAYILFVCWAYWQVSKLYENGLYWKIKDIFGKAQEK